MSVLYGWRTWKVTKSITTNLQVFVNRCLRSIFHIYYIIYYIQCESTENGELKGTNGAGLDILCEKMSLQWSDKLCNEILWMVLDEERGDTKCEGGVQGSKQNLVWHGRAKSSVESWRCWCRMSRSRSRKLREEEFLIFYF